MPVNQSNNGKNIDSQTLEIENNSEKKVFVVSTSKTKKQFYLDNSDRSEELIEIEKSLNRNQNSIFPNLKVKIATLIGSAVMLPILAVGTATYYFGSQALDKQIVLTRQANDLDLVETELVKQQNLLAALLVGTGTTALVAGALAALGIKKLIDGQSDFTSNQTKVDRFFDLNWQQDIFRAIVEEARTTLQCDRVVVYSLDSHKYGTVVAESVAAGYTKAIGKTSANFVAKYSEEYRNGKIKAIEDIEPADLSVGDLEQLKQLEVKANSIAPILNRGRLLGLLVAHQCNGPRKWQRSEINLLHQLATKIGLTIENTRLCDRLTRLQTKAEKESKCTHYFNDAVRHIRQSVEQEEILNISVEEVHRVLKCDRVVVYSLDGDKYGVVVAESVSAGYPRALNKTIENLEAKYRDGIRAIDNIYEGELNQRYIEQLETLKVKASLVTPIWNQGKLFGLLVAHQCSQPRNWQDYEIRWMSQIATQVGFAVDNARVLAESAAVRDRSEIERKYTYYFDNTVKHIRQSSEEILNISVEEVHRVLKCDRVVVYSLDGDKYGVVVAESVSAGYPRALNKTIEELEAKYLEEYRDGRVRAIDNIYEGELNQRSIKQLETLEVKANLVTPVLSGDKLFGLLVAHQCSQPRNWQDYEIRWTSQIATQIGFALETAMLKKLQHDEGSTQSSNDFSLNSQTNESKLLNTTVEQPIEPQEELDSKKNSYANEPEDYTESNNLSENNTDITKTIVEATDIEQLDRLQPNLRQMLGTLHNFEDSDRQDTKLTQLRIEDITVEAKTTSDSVNNAESDLIVGEFVEKSPATSKAITVNQSEGITELSDRISQQSLYLTESFQKLATFAKQLSKKDKK